MVFTNYFLQNMISRLGEIQKKDVVMMGTGEILIILLVILILFGGKKLPEFAQSLGKGIREFKKACNGEEECVIPAEVKEINENEKKTKSNDLENSGY